jgi:hypothetical protein
MLRIWSLLLALSVFLLPACNNEQAEGEAIGASSQALIQDSLHGSGNANFYWLPPFVSKPKPPGVFDASLSPVVRIDELTANGSTARTVAELTTTSGRGAGRVRVNGRAYRVKWNSANAGLDAAKTYRIRVLVAGTQLGVADIDVVKKATDLASVDKSAFVPLLKGAVLPIRFRIQKAGTPPPPADADHDGIQDEADNCPSIANADQLDSDGEGTGDVCECLGTVCGTLDACHQEGVCQATDGECRDPNQPDGTSCDDGSGCTQSDKCTAGVCGSGSACAALASCQGSGSSARCVCATGYTGDGFTCSDIDECASGASSCSPNANCTNSPGSYGCSCKSGYTGDGRVCTTYVAASVDPQAGGTVGVTAPTSPLSGTTVVVPPQTGGTALAISISEPATVAQPVPAEAVGPVAHLSPSGVVFSPPVQLTLVYDKTRVTPEQAAQLSVLRLENPTQGWLEVPPIARDLTAGTVTVLATGFSDWVVFGESSVPDCSEVRCQTAAHVFTGSAWTCDYSNEADGSACDDGNGCTAGESCAAGSCVGGAQCNASAACVGSGATAFCACRPGYTGNGFSCACNAGYQPAANGNGCEPINACLATPNGGCDPLAYCQPTGPGQRTCTCPPNFQSSGLVCTCPTGYQQSGSSCFAINACFATANGGCDPRAQCNSTGPGTRTCFCKSPFVGDGLSCACPSGYLQSGSTCIAINACLMTPNGGCDPHATCTSTGPGTRSCACSNGYQGDGLSCTVVCPSGTHDEGGVCVATVAFDLYAAAVSAGSSQVYRISASTGVGTPLGALGNLSSWSGFFQLDHAAAKAYTVGVSSTGASLVYTFDTASSATTSVSLLAGRLQEVFGTFFDGRVVGTRSGVPDWATFIGDPRTGVRGNSAQFTGLEHTSSASFAMDPGRLRAFAVGTDGNTPQPWLYAVDLPTSTLLGKIQVAHEYVLGAVNAAGNLIAAYDTSSSWAVVELDTATGVATPLGDLGDLTDFDGRLVVDHLLHRAHAHGLGSDGVYRFYTLDLVTGSLTVADDQTPSPAQLFLARATGSCVGTGCDPRDAEDVDPCALGTAVCDPHATCVYEAPSESSCVCDDGFDGDGYSCEAIPPDEPPPEDP